MVSPFSSEVLEFLDAVHRAPRPIGPRVVDALPGVVRERTVYRWHAALGDGLTYFPSLALSGLGLVHAHLFLEGANDRWAELPVAVSALWLNRGLERAALYVHCVIPAGFEGACETLVRSLADDGWCSAWTLVVTGDAWQSLARLRECVDGKGRYRGPCDEPTPREVARVGSDLLRSYPFVVPAVFEAAEERCSLQEIWRRASARLGPDVWRYLPRGTRRWPTNGKRYVRHAQDLLIAAGLFRQNIIRYRPLLDHGVEAFVLVPANHANDVRAALARVCPVLEVSHAADGRALVRLVGDERFVYEWLRLVRESGSCSAWIRDLRRENGALGRARLHYETLFAPTTGTWNLPVDEILATLRSEA